MELSYWGALGALIGLGIGLFNYRVIVAIIEARLRAVDRSETSEERRVFESKLVLLRRFILVFEVVVLTAGGFFVGLVIGGLIGAGG
jgi:hypothetical protein